VNYQITGQWAALSVVTGIAVGLPVILTNSGRAGDLLEVIVSDTEPLESDRGEPLAQLLRSYRISGQTEEVWIRYIRYDLNGTITPALAKTCLLSAQSASLVSSDGGIPIDLYTSTVRGERELKVSAEDPLLPAALNDRAFSFSASYTVPDGQFVSLNMSFAARTVLKRVVVNQGAQAWVYTDHATGQADGIFAPQNMGFCSDDQSPSTSQLFYDSTPVGNIGATGYTELNPYIVVCEYASPSVSVKNTTGASAEMQIHVVYEEIGPRNPSFGLAANTLLEPNTEMSTYG
jgi:hypothetical protein